MSNAMNGMLIRSVADVCAAYGFMCESCEQARPFFAIAALANIHKMRILGIVGFALAAMGKMDIAEKILSLHFSLIGIDDASMPPVARFASGAAGVSLAL
jgi:hypothetical protein